MSRRKSRGLAAPPEKREAVKLARRPELAHVGRVPRKLFGETKTIGSGGRCEVCPPDAPLARAFTWLHYGPRRICPPCAIEAAKAEASA